MRTLILLALLLVTISAAIAALHNSNLKDEQLLTFRPVREASNSEPSEEDEDEDQEGSGSGEILRRFVREASGEESSSSSSEEQIDAPEGSGIKITSAPLRFVRSVNTEGSGEN